MAARYDHSKALRTIGQELVKRGIDIFELRCLRAQYYLQCGDPTPPHTGLIQLSFSDDEVASLEIAAASQRGNTFKLVDFEGLPELLRASGRYVEDKEGQLLKISNVESPLESDMITLEYESRDGRTHVEELPASTLAETARRMYKERSRGKAERPWRH